MKQMVKIYNSCIIVAAVILPLQANAFWDDGNSSSNMTGYGQNNWNNNAYGNGYANGWGDGSGDADMDGDFEIIIKTRARGHGRTNTRGSAAGRAYGNGYNNWQNQYRGYGDQRYMNNGAYAPYGNGAYLRPPVAPAPR